MSVLHEVFFILLRYYFIPWNLYSNPSKGTKMNGQWNNLHILSYISVIQSYGTNSTVFQAYYVFQMGLKICAPFSQQKGLIILIQLQWGFHGWINCRCRYLFCCLKSFVRAICSPLLSSLNSVKVWFFYGLIFNPPCKNGRVTSPIVKNK